MVLVQKKDAEREFLIAGMHSDRARQFVTRLGWDLRTDEFGWEVDEALLQNSALRRDFPLPH